MALRRHALLLASLLAGVLALCGVALAARGYPDRVGDVAQGTGPDLTLVSLSNTKTAVTFRLRFATAPPLRLSEREGWIDMLLIGIDVPPLGPLPTTPGGEWRGANFALGTHGPSRTGLLVKLGQPPSIDSDEASTNVVARFKVVTAGSTLTFSIPRRALGNPAWFAFSVAAARELPEGEEGGGVDLVPPRGTLRYVLTR